MLRRATLCFCGIILSLSLTTPIWSQFASDFEDADYDGSDMGIDLADQDEFYVPDSPGSFDWQVFTYADNEYGFPENPDGDDQFVVGRGPGPDPAGAAQFARSQRDVTYGPGMWTCTVDIAVTFDGTLPSAQNIGSFSTQEFAPPAGGRTFIALARWDDVALADSWNADYVYFTEAGVQTTGEVPDPAFQNLDTETWYRWSTTFDLESNQITEISIENVETGDFYSHEPTDWYLANGPSSTLSDPTGFRLFAGSGTVAGNIVAIDNLIIIRDCDGNGIDDAVEIEDGTADDCNENGVIDSCESGLISTQLIADDATSSAEFGYSIALDEGTLLVGAPADNEAEDDAGAAYFYEYDDGWFEVAKVTAEDAEPDDGFGNAVSLRGDVAAFGVYQDDDLGTSTGSAYVFRRDTDGDWSQEQKLTASDSESGDQFGFAISTDGVRVLVGARATDDPASNAGSAYVFEYDDTDEEWVETALIAASDAAGGDQFGRSVAIDGDVLVIGASVDDDLGSGSGSAYVFRYDSTAEEWVEEDKLLASDGLAADQFGWSVAISGDVIVVGAALQSSTVVDGGAAYIYRYDADEVSWPEEARLEAMSPSIDAVFGETVSIDGDMILVGAPDEDDEMGAAHAFEFDGDDWQALGRVVATTRESEDRFGLGVATDDGLLVCGAPEAGDDTVEGGAIYFVTEADCNENGVPDTCEIEDGTATDSNGNGIPDCCEDDSCGSGPSFIRGDADGSGTFSAILDGLYSLLFAFDGGDPIDCMDAADTDDSGGFSAILDALYGLNFAFNGGDEIAEPGSTSCGPDPTPDLLDCETPPDVCL